MRDFQFTIPYVLDCETGKEISAELFFKQEEAVIFEARRQLEDAIRGRRPLKYSCYYCGQLVKIRGKRDNESKLKRMHFAHQRDSDECTIKTSQTLSREQIQAIKYNGEKESELHRRTKELIASSLERNRLTGRGVTKVTTETVQRDESGLLNWRKPDVSADYKQYKVVFEIQLSTTFLSVIADREHFYQQNQTYIIWVLKHFPEENDRQRFTEKDVFYANNRNAFVFDQEAIEASVLQQDLILKCLYLEPFQVGQNVGFRWKEQLVNLHELTFANETYKVYFYDVLGKTDELKKKIKDSEIKHQQRLSYIDKRYEIAIKKTEDDFVQTRSALAERIQQWFPNAQDRSPLVNELANFSDSTLETLFDIFGQGYQANKVDRSFLTQEFQQEKANRTMLERNDLLTCLCLATCLIKLDKPNKAYRLKKVVGIVFAILSVKIDCVVGLKYNQLIQVAHTVIPGKAEYAHLFLKALEHYPHRTIEQQDAKVNGKFSQKVDLFRQREILINNSYNDVFRLIFPELF